MRCERSRVEIPSSPPDGPERSAGESAPASDDDAPSLRANRVSSSGKPPDRMNPRPIGGSPVRLGGSATLAPSVTASRRSLCPYECGELAEQVRRQVLFFPAPDRLSRRRSRRAPVAPEEPARRIDHRSS